MKIRKYIEYGYPNIEPTVSSLLKAKIICNIYTSLAVTKVVFKIRPE